MLGNFSKESIIKRLEDQKLNLNDIELIELNEKYISYAYWPSTLEKHTGLWEKQYEILSNVDLGPVPSPSGPYVYIDSFSEQSKNWVRNNCMRLESTIGGYGILAREYSTNIYTLAFNSQVYTFQTKDILFALCIRCQKNKKDLGEIHLKNNISISFELLSLGEKCSYLNLIKTARLLPSKNTKIFNPDYGFTESLIFCLGGPSSKSYKKAKERLENVLRNTINH